MSPWPGSKSDGSVPESSLRSDGFTGDSELDNESFDDYDPFLDLPREILDPGFTGPNLKTHHRCRHGDAPQRKVAFDMATTGRRFLGCSHQGADRCSFVVWVDEPWNPVLTRSLIHLWSLIGLNSRDEIVPNDVEAPIDQAYIALWTEKNNMQLAFEQKEHQMKTRELKLKEIIRHNSERASRSLNICANVSISAASVAVTLFAVLVFVLLK
ncbi:hypothetical protein ACQ4PT_028369 [Festuca glaucescens]